MADQMISLIMPVYNDEDTVLATLRSIITQDYRQWELIVINDGSTDRTPQLLGKFVADHPTAPITIINQENADQLNAIIAGINLIRGDLVYIIHGDDLLADDGALARMNASMQDPDLDGAMADLLTIDHDGREVGRQTVQKYAVAPYIVGQQTLWLGRNLFVDFAIWRTRVFCDSVQANYLTWNTVAWLDCRVAPPRQLRITNAPQPFIRYRVGDGHYIDNPIGILNVINGELRTLVSLLASYRAPNYAQQYRRFRLANKLHLLNYYRPRIKPERTPRNEVAGIIRLALSKYPQLPTNPYTPALIGFYAARGERTIHFSLPSDFTVWYGKDMRVFNTAMQSDELPDTYGELFTQMIHGFTTMIVPAGQGPMMQDVLHFLNIWPYVTVKEEQV
ncbi:glycosyltransferase family 2 protein [Schleiferilactobacillus harbinensis]|uniref:glycosyltransferase family 2 protein n=1 Tax=Schleiferilactobacillus harbinensis TaxID=304207 RepID=UPI00345E2255